MKLDKSRVKLLAFALFIVLCIALAQLPGVRKFLTLESINAHLQSLSAAANTPQGPFIYVGIIILVIIFHMPALVPVVLGGLVYDPWLAVCLSLTGGVIGSTLTFLMARFFLRDFFAPRLQKSFLIKYVAYLEAHGIFTMAMMRMLAAMSPIPSWLAGVSKISIRDYVVGNLIGLFPLIVLVTVVANRLRAITSLSDLLRPDTMIPFALFMALVVAIFVVRTKLKARAETTAEPAVD